VPGRVAGRPRNAEYQEFPAADPVGELASAIDPAAPFTAALLLWSAWHGLVSLRLHKTDWDWGLSAEEANARIITALTRAAGASSAAI
jgi:hypothetical protein